VVEAGPRTIVRLTQYRTSTLRSKPILMPYDLLLDAESLPIIGGSCALGNASVGWKQETQARPIPDEGLKSDSLSLYE
jgi:hypothetical protein